MVRPSVAAAAARTKTHQTANFCHPRCTEAQKPAPSTSPHSCVQDMPQLEAPFSGERRTPPVGLTVPNHRGCVYPEKQSRERGPTNASTSIYVSVRKRNRFSQVATIPKTLNADQRSGLGALHGTSGTQRARALAEVVRHSDRNGEFLSGRTKKEIKRNVGGRGKTREERSRPPRKPFGQCATGRRRRTGAGRHATKGAAVRPPPPEACCARTPNRNDHE